MKYLYLGLSLAAAVVGAVTDTKYGRVKNKHLLIALCLWLLIAIIGAIHNGAFVSFSTPFLLNFLLGSVASIFLYLCDIWAPGDAKLYLLIILIFPFNCYIRREGNIFPSLDLIVFAFAIGYCILIFDAFFKRQEKGKNEFSLKNTGSMGFALTGVISNAGIISAAGSITERFFPVFYYGNSILIILLITVFILLTSKYRIKNIVGFICFCIFVIVSIINGDIFGTIKWCLQGAVIALIISYANGKIRQSIYRSISGDEIKPGMILSFASVWSMQKCIDPDIPRSTTETRRSRLTDKQAIAVKEWCRITKREVTVVEMLPFAPSFAAAVLVIILRFFLYQ